MQDLENHFCLSYREVDEICSSIVEAAITENASKRVKTLYREDQKLYWNYNIKTGLMMCLKKDLE